MTCDLAVGTVRQLPAPSDPGVTLYDALRLRRSSREYADRDLSDEELSLLLWCAAGRTKEDGHRTIPSARDHREISLFLIDRRAVWRYCSGRHALVAVRPGDFRGDTTTEQEYVRGAAATIVLAADQEREKGIERWVGPDAGMPAFAVQLAATALGLGSVIRGLFDPAVVDALICQDGSKRARLCVTVGPKA